MAEEQTARNTGDHQHALNYGGRAEIVEAARRAIYPASRPRISTNSTLATCSTRPVSLTRSPDQNERRDTCQHFLLWQIATPRSG
jgi:undecaprenyl pyrophosphate synthase